MSELKQKYIDRIQQMGQDPKKSLGQNFLIHEGAIQAILERVNVAQPSHIIEVGPGLGALTDELKQLVFPLTLIELDQNFYEYWKSQFTNETPPSPSVREIVYGDALKLDWKEVLDLPDNAMLVSNLPYQISSSLVIERSLGPNEITSMVLMFQKEVADRIMARPKSKDYGILSVIAQTYWQMEKVISLGPGAFWPPPKVSSQVLSFRRRPPCLPHGGEEYLRFVKSAFAQRRKMLYKNWMAYFSARGLGKEALTDFFKKLNWDLTVRAEQVPVNEFIRAYSCFTEND